MRGSIVFVVGEVGFLCNEFRQRRDLRAVFLQPPDDEIRLLLGQFRDVVFKRKLLYPKMEVVVVPGEIYGIGGG